MSDSNKAGGVGEGGVMIDPNGPSLAQRAVEIVNDIGPNTPGGVFDSFAKTITGKNLYEVDNAEDDFKLLNPKQMAHNMAMAGLTPGVHQHRIKGNTAYQFLGNRSRVVDGSDFLVVKEKQMEEVIGDSILTYDGDRRVVVGKTDDLSVQQSQSIFVLGPSSEQYHGKHDVTAPEDFEWKQLESGFTATSVDLTGWDVSVTAGATELKVLETSVKTVKAFLEGYREGAKGNEGKAVALRDEVIPLAAVLIFRVNGLVQICAITPFG